LRREFKNKKLRASLRVAPGVVRKGSLSLELPSTFLQREIYEDWETSFKSIFLSTSLFRVVSETEMRWRQRTQ